MNPVLVLLTLLGVGGLWFVLAFTFGFFGKITNKFKDDAKNAMFDEVENENK